MSGRTSFHRGFRRRRLSKLSDFLAAIAQISDNLTMDKQYQYKIELLVRDYECDLQGVVNNANYQHYLEHARHEYLYSAGIDFAKLHDDGTDLIVSRVELDYKFPLKSRDRFVVCINAHREGRLRFVLEQDIYRLPDEKLVLTGKVTAVALQNGRPIALDVLVQALEHFVGTSSE